MLHSTYMPYCTFIVLFCATTNGTELAGNKHQQPVLPDTCTFNVYCVSAACSIDGWTENISPNVAASAEYKQNKSNSHCCFVVVFACWWAISEIYDVRQDNIKCPFLLGPMLRHTGVAAFFASSSYPSLKSCNAFVLNADYVYLGNLLTYIFFKRWWCA